MQNAFKGFLISGEKEGLFHHPCAPRVKMQKVILRIFFNFPALMKVNFQRSVKLKNPPEADFLHLSAGKEVHSSNRFKEDLSQILDFLEENRKEIKTIK